MPNRMTRHGPQQPIGAPALPVVDPDDFAEHVVDAFAAGDFLICSTPEAFDALARRGPRVTTGARLSGTSTRNISTIDRTFLPRSEGS